MIEWSQFIEDLLPDESLTINIEVIDETSRHIKIEAKGEHYEVMKEALEQ